MTKESNKGLSMQMIYTDMRKCTWRLRVGMLTIDISWSTTSLPYWLTYSLHCSEEAGRKSELGTGTALHPIHTSISESALSPARTSTAPAGRTGSQCSQ